MPKTDDENPKALLKKIASELSRQRKATDKMLRAERKRTRKILDQGLKGMDPGLRDIILEIFEAREKPHFPFLPVGKEK